MPDPAVQHEITRRVRYALAHIVVETLKQARTVGAVSNVAFDELAGTCDFATKNALALPLQVPSCITTDDVIKELVFDERFKEQVRGIIETVTELRQKAAGRF